AGIGSAVQTPEITMARGGICTIRKAMSIVLAALSLSACTATRYAKTNKQYRQQLKGLTEQMQEPLPYATPRLVATYDSTTGVTTVSEIPQTKREAHQVASIHFNLRKP